MDMERLSPQVNQTKHPTFWQVLEEMFQIHVLIGILVATI